MGDLTLAEFLAARLGEDEAEARKGAGPPSLRRRQLREVEAKRKILAEYSENPGAEDRPWTAALEYAMMALAEVYSDHPDYNNLMWKP